ncbi:glycosyltransferase [Balneola sp. MJW-20]|uniref:glycosyltransferase n=1 Tax=Gracilimonas aurantiaca TaxID=3234185 RepID=UPI003465332A
MILSDKKIFIIGTVWPEPNSSAAGLRMIQLITFLRSEGAELIFGSSASMSDHSYDLESLDVRCVRVEINNVSFDDLISSMNPDMVIYDRFMTEEQYGWRVTDQCPNAIQILDTEDLHFMREGRRMRKEQFATQENITDYLNLDIAMRELSSIFRCDLSMIISTAEMDILKHLRVPEELLQYIPIVYDAINTAFAPAFGKRNGFFTIGNFRHPPNRDSVQYLYEKVWPLIRQQLPDAQMHVYGSYPAEKDMQLDQPEKGFHIHGRADDLDQVLQKHRLMLAPLRFGAGIKGKFLSAFNVGIPAVTTSIGAEGINSQDPGWPGAISDSPSELAQKAVQLYIDQEKWVEASGKCRPLINNHFLKDDYFQSFAEKLKYLHHNVRSHRSRNLIGQLLRFNANRSTMFMSKWIEEKNKN